MKLASHVLHTKGYDVWMIAPDASVYSALTEMANRNVGALLVVDQNGLMGIISERDCARKLVLEGRTARDTLVREIMTDKVFSVRSGQTLEECMELMTEKRIRHLPVLENGRVIGVLSIGDVVKSIIDDKVDNIRRLETYLWRKSQ